MTLLSLNTNIQSLNIHRHLNLAHQSLDKSLERLSTGLRINRAADDAAGLAISKGMTTQIRSKDQALKNIQFGFNYLNTAESGLVSVSEQLQRMRELVIQAANDTNTASDREKIQAEITQLQFEIDNTAVNTQFNGKQPLQIDPARLKELTLFGGPADIVVVIDGGGSMAPHVANFQANLSNFANQLRAAGVDPQFALAASATVSGGHPGRDDFDATTLVQDLTDEATFNAALLGFPNIGGTSQDTFSSLVETANDQVVGNEGAGSDTPSRRLLPDGSGFVPLIQILISDHHPEQQVGAITGFPPTVGGYSPAREAAVAAFLAAQDNVITYAVLEPGEFDHFDAITAATGGDIYDITSPTFGNDLLNLANQIAQVSNLAEGQIVRDPGAFSIQIDAEQGTYIALDNIHVSSFLLGVLGINVTRNNNNFDQDILDLDRAIDLVTDIRATLGAKHNRLDYAQSHLSISKESLLRSNSRIADTDYAQETSNLTRSQIITQASTALLAQTNLLPVLTLDLIR